jgi:phytoene dehydrogenase-like protein
VLIHHLENGLRATLTLSYFNLFHLNIVIVFFFYLFYLFIGFCFPIGGGSEIPYRILPVIERSGGRVLMKAHVIEILTNGGKVTGVRVKGNSGVVDIPTSVVISDAGAYKYSDEKYEF